MKFRVIITPRRAVRHPESECIKDTLQAMGFTSITALTIGKIVDIEVRDGEVTQKDIENFADKRLANPNMEDFKIEVVK